VWGWGGGGGGGGESWARQSGVVGIKPASRIGFIVAVDINNRVVSIFTSLSGDCPDCCFVFWVRCRLTLRDLALNRRLGVPQSWSGHRGAQKYFLLLSRIYPQFLSYSACSLVCITDEISCLRFWHLLRAKAESPLTRHKKKHSLLMTHFIRDAGEVYVHDFSVTNCQIVRVLA